MSTHAHDEDKKPKAIHFGAGNIGRGFIAPLLSGAGYTVVFADVDKVPSAFVLAARSCCHRASDFKDVINRLNEENRYEVYLLDEETSSFAVDDVIGVISTSDDIVRAIADPNAYVLTTAVGLPVLEKVAPTIAAGLIKRREIGGDVMNVIACEVRAPFCPAIARVNALIRTPSAPPAN
jgi:mannitol-1-phosphate 5-dehydrogenase